MLGLPLPYCDELLYSTIARYGIHSGIVSPKELLQEVFGDTKIIATPDLPGHLKRIADLYPEVVGITPGDLLYEHTLFPLYAPFIGEERRRCLTRELMANRKSTVHLTAGVAASRVKQPAFLRYCPGCIKEQINQYGECYWRRDWQVAGAESCPVHGFLVESDIRRHDMHRHLFQAASESACPAVVQQPGSWQSDLILNSVRELLNLESGSVPELCLWSLWYRNLAVDNHLNRGTQVRHDFVANRIVEFWGEKWLGQYGLLPNGGEPCWLRNMFRKHRKAFSYLEHLVVLHALLERGWNLADVFRVVSGLNPAEKAFNKALKGTDKAQLSEYRNKWLAAVAQHGIKGARSHGYGGIYAWLYRRDRDWLMNINEAHRKPEYEHLPKVSWAQRDMRAVRRLIDLREQSEVQLEAPRRSMNWYLNQLEHKASVEKHLDLLPLCSLFFARYCESIFEYQIRRITCTVIHITRDDEPLKRWQVLRGAGLSEQRLTDLARRFLEEVLEI